jgi:iron(III) transport system permease protein
LTVTNYETLIADPHVEQALVSSTLLAIATVVGALLIGGLISYVALKGGFQHARWIELIGMAPLAVPPTVYSVGLLLTVLSSPAIAAVAYGSVWVMFIASVFAFLPIVTRLLTSALIQIQDDLLNAATVSGAGRLHTIRTILIPLLRPAVASAAAVVFMLSYRELGAVVLLVSNNTQLIPSVIFRYLEGGNFTQVAALNIIMIIVPIVFATLAFSFGAGRRGSRQRAARSLISSETSLATNEGTLDAA